MKGVVRLGYRHIGTARLKIWPIKLSNDDLLQALNGFESVEQFAQYILTRSSPAHIIQQKNRKRTVQIIRTYYPDIVRETISRADRACDHVFDLLGSGATKVERDGVIAWDSDFKSNKVWPLVHRKSLALDYPDGRSDVKVPWELSRCQHFVTLGKAYWFSGDEKYAREFVNQIESWVSNNPVELGVNWACSMDVAIRAANWLVGLQFFRTSSSISDEFMITLAESLLAHGRHIRANLEIGPVTNNHYLSDLVGLLYISTFLPKAKESSEWNDFAISELMTEMSRQVRPDGMDFEGSTCYHRLALELFFYSALLCVVNHESFEGQYRETAEKVFGLDYVERLYRMFEFVLYTLKPNGKMPQVGDNDNGRLHIFSDSDVLDMRYLLDFGSIFFDEPRFKVKEFAISEDAIWLFGGDGYGKLKGSSGQSVEELRSREFVESGIYVLRDGDIYMIIHCASNGQNGMGGHNHNDVLSFEVSVAGMDIIVDPGTYVYTSDFSMRNIFRSSKSHNGVTIDGQDPNRFVEREIFSMFNDAKPKVLNSYSNSEHIYFEAEHYGYTRLSDPVVHRRIIVYSKRKKNVEVRDKFEGRGKHLLEWSLILSPDTDQGIRPLSKELQWVVEPAWYSPSYGSLKTTSKLCARMEATMPYEAQFVIPLEEVRIGSRSSRA